MPDFAFSDGPWMDCFESFLTSIAEKSGSKHSHKRYRAVLTAFFSSPAKMPNLYLRSDVESFIRAPGNAPGREGNPVSFGSQNNKLSILKSFFKYCSTYAVIDAQGVPRPLLDQLAPTAGIRFVERERPPYRSMDEQALKAFFAAIPGEIAGLPDVIALRNRAIFLALFWLARRVNEVLELKFGDITASIFVEGGVRRSGWLYHWRGKGHQRFVDSAEMVPVVYSAITTYLSAAGRLETIQPDDYIFVADAHWAKQQNREIRLRNSTVWMYCKKYASAAGLGDGITVHSFRHAAAMHRTLAGSSLLDVAHILRHKNLNTTSIYLRELRNESDTGASLLEQRFASL
jgi:site-specific recombinase XerD